MTKIMIGCRCLPNTVLKDGRRWEDRLLGRERGPYAGSSTRKQGSQRWSPCLQFS